MSYSLLPLCLHCFFFPVEFPKYLQNSPKREVACSKVKLQELVLCWELYHFNSDGKLFQFSCGIWCKNYSFNRFRLLLFYSQVFLPWSHWSFNSYFSLLVCSQNCSQILLQEDGEQEKFQLKIYIFLIRYKQYSSLTIPILHYDNTAYCIIM